MVEKNSLFKYEDLGEEKDFSLIPDRLKHTSVSLVDIFNNQIRLEASAFSLDAKIAKEKVLNCPYGFSTITGKNGLAEAYRPGITKREYVSKGEGIPMFTPSQISEVFPKPYKFIGKDQADKLQDWYLVKGELVLTCSGSIGEVSYVGDTLAGKLFSQNMIRVKSYGKMGFLYAFLKTEVGNSLLTSNLYGAVIQHIDPDHLNNVFVPNAPEATTNRIHDLIMESFSLRDKSNNLIQTAEDKLYEELQLPEIHELEPSFYSSDRNLQNYVTKLSELNYRFEGSFHEPMNKSILKILQTNAQEVKYIGDREISEEIVLPGRFKRVYVDKKNGVPFFGGKELLDLNPRNIKYLSLDQHGDRIAQQLFLKQNMTAVTCSGTIGKVNIIPRHWENFTLNQHVMRIVPAKKEVAGYIYCWLNTDYGKQLITRHTYGSVVDEIDERHLSKVEIPILKNQEVQKEINDMVLDGNRLRYEAHLKEQQAIKEVEALLDADREGFFIA